MRRYPNAFGGIFGENPMVSGENNQPAAPVQSTPADGATVAHASFDPTWLAARRANSYEIQTATNVNMVTGLVTTAVSALHIATLGLTAGTYYWRVRGVNSKGKGAFSAIRSVILS